jgi:hypothetical protein
LGEASPRPTNAHADTGPNHNADTDPNPDADPNANSRGAEQSDRYCGIIYSG